MAVGAEMTKAKPGARPPLVVRPARFVPMTAEQEARAFTVMKALFITYLREQRSRLDNPYQMEPSWTSPDPRDQDK